MEVPFSFKRHLNPDPRRPFEGNNRIAVLPAARELREYSLMPCCPLLADELDETQRFQLGMDRHQSLGGFGLQLLIGA